MARDSLNLRGSCGRHASGVEELSEEHDIERFGRRRTPFAPALLGSCAAPARRRAAGHGRSRGGRRGLLLPCVRRLPGANSHAHTDSRARGDGNSQPNAVACPNVNADTDGHVHPYSHPDRNS